MKEKTILVTGGAGFIGSNYLNYKSEKSNSKLINLDKLTYAADLNNIKINETVEYTLVEGDIYNYGLIDAIFSEHKIDVVVHFAAESHVDNSINDPRVFINTNIIGTFNLLEAAYKNWMKSPNKLKSEYKDARFLHISTDEVYGTLGKTGVFTEDSPYAPNSPYSSSKASSDMLVRSYYHTYGLPVLTTNCSNNYGPRQHDEKLIPTIIRKALHEENIPIYGDGKNIRDWLYVLDHCRAIDLVLEKGKLGETYNVGGKNERENLYIATIICEILDKIKPRSSNKSYKDLIVFVDDRPGHDYRYAIDASKIEKELGWIVKENFETGIKKTVDWYLEKDIKQRKI